MHQQTHANKMGYLVIIIGVLLSFVSALVPHFDAGYRVLFLVFVTGMLPYTIYGIAVPLIRGPLVSAVGVLIVIAHTLLVFNQRFAGNIDYSDGLIYIGPIGIAVAAVPLAVLAMRRTWKPPAGGRR